MSDKDAAADVPLGGLTPAERVLLQKPQLELAVVEVRFVGAQEAVTSEQALAIRDAMDVAGYELPQVQPAQTQDLTLRIDNGEVEPEVNTRAAGWVLTSADGLFAATILPGVIAIQTTRYERWSNSLEAPLFAVLKSVGASLKPTIVQRIGLRYINRLHDEAASTIAAWTDAIAPSFFGVLNDPEIGPKAVACQQQVSLELGDTQGAVIRHGVFSDPSSRGMYSYLVDIDAFDHHSRAFSENDICDRARALNRTALSLFQQVVTREYRDTMDPYAEVDSSGNAVQFKSGAGEGAVV